MDILRIQVSLGEILLQVLLDIVASTHLVDQFKHPFCVDSPIGGIGHGKIIGSSDLVQVDERMGGLYDGKAALDVQGGFQRYPGEDASIVKLSQGCNPISRGSCHSFPLAREGFVQAREGRGKGIPSWAKEVEVSECSTAPLGECADSKAVLLQGEQHGTGQGVVPRVIGVCGEGEHHLLLNPQGLILPGILDEQVEEVGAGDGGGIKVLPFHPEHLGNIAIKALVGTSSIGIGGESGIFPGLPPRCIDDRASLHAPSILIQFWLFHKAILSEWFDDTGIERRNGVLREPFMFILTYTLTSVRLWKGGEP